MEQREIEQAAKEIESWIQDAVGDMAFDIVNCNYFCIDNTWKEKVKKAKEDGVQDLQGWLADEYYNDVDTLYDLCGDRIYEASKDNNLDFIAIAEEIKIGGHNSLIEAMDKLIQCKKSRVTYQERLQLHRKVHA